LQVKNRSLPAAMLSGLLLLLATPGLPGTPLLAWIGLIPLLRTIEHQPPRRAILAGLTTGMIFHTGLLYWIIIVLGRYGQLPLWLSLPALLLLAAYMSLYTALFAAGLARCKNIIPLTWAAPLLWVGLDFIRAHLLTGFPWQDLGYSQFQLLPIIQIADLCGHHGVTFLIVMTNCLLLALFRAGRNAKGSPPARWWQTQLPAILLLAAALAYGNLRLTQVENLAAKAAHLPTTVVQGNIAQDQKWLPAFQEQTMTTYLEQSLEAMKAGPSRLLVWPETALPFFPMENRRFRELLTELTAHGDTCLLTGAPHRASTGTPPTLQYFNSAMLFGPATPSTRYDKQHLVPFGEYMPLRRLLPLPGPLVESIGDFTPGTSSAPLPCPGGAKAGVLICFESIFPELARAEVEQGADLLINITNDAWFGRSTAPWQHLSMAVFRAVETRRSLARAANTGISGFVEPTGRLKNLSPLFATYATTAALPLLTNQTIYLVYGHYFPLACLLLTAPLILIAGKKRQRDG